MLALYKLSKSVGQLQGKLSISLICDEVEESSGWNSQYNGIHTFSMFFF